MTISERLTELLNAAIAAFNTGRHDDAERGCRQTLAAVPHNTMALMVLGTAISHRADGSEGTAWLARAVCIAGDDANIHNTLGNLRLRHGDPGRAAANYRRALALAPGFAQAQYNLGNLHVASPLRGIVHWLKRAVAAEAGLASAWAAISVSGAGRDSATSRAAARRALALDPAHVVAWVGIGISALLLPGRTSAVAANLRALAAEPRNEAAWTNLRTALQYDATLGNDRIFSIVRRWGSLVETDVPNTSRPAKLPSERQPLRIGYLSADFRSHVIANNVEGLLACHDRTGFEVYLYAEVAQPDEVSRRLARTGTWRPTVGRSDADVARLIESDAIDILVSLAGHTAGNRLSVLAHRAAPVQLSFHDISSSGLLATDGWITDGVLHPVDTSERFTETLLRLPCFYLHAPPDPCPEIAPPAFVANGHVTFGSFNSLAKLTDEMFDIWARILSRVPRSRLLIGYSNQLADPAVADRVISQFARNGIGCERLSLAAESLPRYAHLARLSKIDIALDAFPFNGSTTTFEALWMGAPVVTLAGDRFVSRVGASLLNAVGEHRLAADTIDRYVEVAVELACDEGRLTELRRTLRQRVQASPLCDALVYTRSIEALYRKVWRGETIRPGTVR